MTVPLTIYRLSPCSSQAALMRQFSGYLQSARGNITAYPLCALQQATRQSLGPGQPGRFIDHMDRAPRKVPPVNQVRSYNGALQLILQVGAKLANGQCKQIKILVDTGAEANLIKTGIIPPHLTFPAVKSINLVSANGQPIRGGQDSQRQYWLYPDG